MESRNELEIAYCQRCGKALIAPLKQEDTNGIVIKGKLNVLCLKCAEHVALTVADDQTESQGDSEE